MKTKRITQLGMLLAVSLVLSYLETLLPVVVAVPGVKLGLANIITMLLLYRTNAWNTFLFMGMRVILSGFLFSGISGMIYSIAGGIFCIVVMSIVKRFPFFSIIGVSMAGAIAHNIGQVVVAVIIMENVHLLYYALVLCVSGTCSGLLMGYITALILKRYIALFED